MAQIGELLDVVCVTLGESEWMPLVQDDLRQRDERRTDQRNEDTRLAARRAVTNTVDGASL